VALAHDAHPLVVAIVEDIGVVVEHGVDPAASYECNSRVNSASVHHETIYVMPLVVSAEQLPAITSSIKASLPVPAKVLHAGVAFRRNDVIYNAAYFAVPGS
jgi:hypothetical protein